LPHLFKKLPWDHTTDLIPVTTLAVTPLVVVVGSNAPYKTRNVSMTLLHLAS
jgi:tripartite-type tricarboxylate transporter receptor subunit TctC